MNKRNQFSHMPPCTIAVLLQIRIPSNRGENILAFLPSPSLVPRLPLRLFLLMHRSRWHPSQRKYSRCFPSGVAFQADVNSFHLSLGWKCSIGHRSQSSASNTRTGQTLFVSLKDDYTNTGLGTSFLDTTKTPGLME
jgi:hypothetical protein